LKTLRTAIIGPGKVAHNHARALVTLPQSNFVAVYGRNQQRAQEFAAQYDIAAYTNVTEMVEQSKIEAVIVCTPHPAHAKPAVAAMQAGAHVLVEKPLASNLVDCDAMIDTARATGLKLGVVSQRRFYDCVRRVRSAIDDGKLGRPVLGMVHMLSWRDEAYYASDPWRGTWQAEGGGVLVNQSPHQLDLLQWFMGPIDELFGYWDNLNHPYIEVDDTAVAVIRFKNGGLGSILVSNSQKPGIYGKVHVHGSNGASVGVQTESGAMFIAGVTNVADPPLNDLWTIPGEEHLLEQWQQADRATFAAGNITQHYFNAQVEDFLQAILDDRDPLITGEQGRVTVEIFSAIYQSQRDRRPIRFPVASDV
jgi:predicted dehydrogenase